MPRPKSLRRQSPLRADRAPSANGTVMLDDRSLSAKFILHGRPDDAAFTRAVASALGLELPGVNHTAGSERTLLWLAPREWLLVAATGEEDGMAQLLTTAGIIHADISDGWACIRLSGSNALDVLKKSTPLHVHPRVFLLGHCARTRFVQAAVLLHRVAETTYDLYCERSYADYLWRWLADAAQEFA